MRSILASKDGLAIDTVESNIMNINHTTVGHLSYLTTRGEVGSKPGKRLPVRGNTKDIIVLGNIKVDDIRTNFAGSMSAGGTKLQAAQLTQPTVTISSAAFTGQNLNIKTVISASVVKADIYIDGNFLRSVNESLDDITVDASKIASGNRQITLRVYTQFMVSNVASLNATK